MTRGSCAPKPELLVVQASTFIRIFPIVPVLFCDCYHRSRTDRTLLKPSSSKISLLYLC